MGAGDRDLSVGVAEGGAVDRSGERGDWRATLAFSGGVAVAILGALVMVGWHLGSVTLTRVVPAFRPMVYLTAVGFLLSGISLIARHFDLRLLARSCAGFLALASAIRTLEHAAGISSGIDNLGIGPHAKDVLGQMAPLTAAGFTLTSLAVLDSLGTRGRRHRPLEALAGAIVIGTGAIAVFGYGLGNPAYIWGPLTGMAIHTAVGLVVLGGCVVLLAWQGEGRSVLPKWIPLFVFAGCLTASLSFWMAVRSQETAELQAALQRHAHSLAEEASSAIEGEVQAIGRMAKRLESLPDMPRAAWEADARLYLGHYAGLESLAVLDSSSTPRWIVPSNARETEDTRSVLSSRLLRAARDEAVRTGSVVASPIFRSSRQAGAFVVCSRLGSTGAQPSFLLATVRVNPLFDSIWLPEIVEGYSIEVSDEERLLYRRQPAGMALESASTESPLEIAGLPLRIRVWSPPFLDRARSRLPTIALAGGLLASLLFALLSYLALRSRDSARAERDARHEIENQTNERERTVAALAQSEARFRAMSEASPFGLFLTNGLGECVYVNQATAEITGVAPDEALGYGWTRTLHPEDRERVFAEWKTAMARKGVFSSTHRFVRGDGTVVWVEGTAALIDSDAAASGYVGVLRDVTESREARLQLEERSRLAAFAADVGAALTEGSELGDGLQKCAQAIVKHLDVAMASLWTLDEKESVLELKGTAWEGDPLFPPEARVPVGMFRVGAVARNRRPINLDLLASARPDDGDWATREGMAAFAGYPLLVGERLVGVMAMYSIEPMTETALQALASVADEVALGVGRLGALEALQVSEASIRSVIANMLGGLIVVDSQGVIESLNPAAEMMFGYREKELVGRTLAVLLPPGPASEPESFLRDASKRSMGKITEWEARRKSGEIFPMELALFRFQTPDGLWHLAGNVRDISERRAVDKLKKEFVSTVSHELRTPLTSIRGSLRLLGGGVLGELSSEAREIVALAERNVVRLIRLINDILDLERFDTGRVQLKIEDLPVADAFARALEAVRAFATDAGISVVVREPGTAVRTDRDRLVQVLVNLLSNAVKFSPRGSTVVLSAEGEGDVVALRVADRGRGIPASMRDSIFERFRQLEASDAREKGGTGLGLAISKSIIERLGGRIGVESEEGKGSTFWIRLPRAPAAVAAPGAATAGNAAPGRHSA